MQRLFVQFFSFLFPSKVADFAYKKLTSPQVQKLRANEMEVLAKAQSETVKFLGFDIKTYQWGNPNHEKILLIHGWEGQAGNFADLINRLLESEYYVLSFDGPSHGYSSKGSTSLIEFSELVGTLINYYQTKKLVSHSFGGVATTYALYKAPTLQIDKYALLTTPDKFSQRIDDVAQKTGISNKVKKKLKDRIQSELEIDIADLNVSSFVQKIKVNQSMILHDKNDRIIPIAQSKNVSAQWANCQFVPIEGTGHFRILRTNSVLNKVIAFMDN